MAAGTAAVILTVESGVARLRLDRPERRNAMDRDLAEQLLDAVHRIAADTSVRCVLISAAGDHFSVGGDIGHFLGSEPERYGALFGRMTAPFHEAVRVLSRVEAPVVAAVQGSVVGMALSLVCAADILVAADDARFVTAFAGIGLPGDGGITWLLPRLVGVRRATSLLMLNTPFGPDEALEWGLISEVVPRADLDNHVQVLVSRLAQGPTVSLGLMRRLIDRSHTSTFAEHLLDETVATMRAGASADAVEGISAFSHKRRPHFEGR